MAPPHRAFLVSSLVELLIRHSIDRQRQSITYLAFGDNRQLFDLILANAHEDVIGQFIHILLKSLILLTAEQAAAGFVSILGLRQSSREEIERSYTCPTLRASHKEGRVKKKRTTNGSRHGLLPEFDLVDVTGKRSKRASDAPESGKMLGNTPIVGRHIIERFPMSRWRARIPSCDVELWNPCSGQPDSLKNAVHKYNRVQASIRKNVLLNPGTSISVTRDSLDAPHVSASEVSQADANK
ncbi:hypothetical protein DFJ58DRAFT_880062 [Suillus subalutaceus]|uniref:uncharacterized protein n=1 Tax=Suillus subalutaceus TaxID=48586 RepID=UPI001B874FCB|nr:uncharacterized protein DFJ58DRAFT_880062 [Suillus subalutaceus]KAG1856073.1 hypothetical protein DFJ58DRAFT_880062 [Suillus subalutaceus]